MLSPVFCGVVGIPARMSDVVEAPNMKPLGSDEQVDIAPLFIFAPRVLCLALCAGISSRVLSSSECTEEFLCLWMFGPQIDSPTMPRTHFLVCKLVLPFLGARHWWYGSQKMTACRQQVESLLAADADVNVYSMDDFV